MLSRAWKHYTRNFCAWITRTRSSYVLMLRYVAKWVLSLVVVVVMNRCTADSLVGVCLMLHAPGRSLPPLFPTRCSRQLVPLTVGLACCTSLKTTPVMC